MSELLAGGGPRRRSGLTPHVQVVAELRRDADRAELALLLARRGGDVVRVQLVAEGEFLQPVEEVRGLRDVAPRTLVEVGVIRGVGIELRGDPSGARGVGE